MRKTSRVTGRKTLYMRGAKGNIAYNVEEKPIDQGKGWSVYKVNGRPSQHFGMVSLSNEPVLPGASFGVISALAQPNQSDPIIQFVQLDCQALDEVTSTSRFKYNCDGQDKLNFPAVDFIVDPFNQLLVGLGLKSGEPGEIRSGLPISRIAKDSSLMSSHSPGPSAYDKIFWTQDLTCEKAASLAADQEKLLGLWSFNYDRVSVYLRACGEQIALNKTKELDQRVLVVIRPLSKDDNQYTFEYITKEDVDKIVYACMANSFAPRVVELLNTIVAKGTAEARFDWSERLGCYRVSNGLRNNQPYLIEQVILGPELGEMQSVLEFMDYIVMLQRWLAFGTVLPPPKMFQPALRPFGLMTA